MIEEKNIQEIEIYGRIITSNFSYDLLKPLPVNLDEWAIAPLLCFYVCITPANTSVPAIPRHIVISGSYVIDYGYAGKKVKIQTQEVHGVDMISVKVKDLKTQFN